MRKCRAAKEEMKTSMAISQWKARNDSKLSANENISALLWENMKYSQCNMKIMSMKYSSMTIMYLSLLEKYCLWRNICNQWREKLKEKAMKRREEEVSKMAEAVCNTLACLQSIYVWEMKRSICLTLTIPMCNGCMRNEISERKAENTIFSLKMKKRNIWQPLEEA